MTEPLLVDPSRLKAAGNTLQALAFPVPPASLSAPGADAVSAAINVTLPIIESPVIEGLPAVNAAIKQTGSSIVTAAALYVETDQALGERVGNVQLLSAPQGTTVGGSAAQSVGPAADESKGDETPGAPKPEPEPEPDKTIPNYDKINSSLGQLSGLTQALNPVTQQLQSIMSSVQQAAGNSGATPAQLADDATDTAQSTTEEAQLVDQEEGRGPDPLTEGAAAGGREMERAPATPPTTPNRPEPARSQIQL
ncbi:MAG: hypothetical protein JOZ00_11945 [Mycobacterium sp.]|uniref:hypothetical protein n=1 Tax=Mycobacterium sp. TaxID=1785 RepID=UPI001ED43D0E|nr:hypothetical protein [Mycobacterium sp.]MBV8787388.1 hypothetical protein [Mycobacterium sp.]